MSKKTLTGTVVSTKMNKTVSVAVEYLKSHPLYSKKMKQTKKFLAHNEKEVSEGDTVIITESKPYSKKVKFEVTEVLKG
ncbi:MAG: 30S ribosomal protein S17 [Proteobacteria bacterium]|nr:30S ribosomal protein S17 [Pseudomonadota bacterium]